uniref:Uncharacterized protein n=1 Tax=Micrurus carvalhoi TaxID=3147026 RepID=A0A2H6MUD3_9SAUR
MFVSLHRNSLGSITCRKWHASESFPSLLHDFTHCISLQTVLTKCVQGINGQRAVRSRVAVQKIKVKSRFSFSFNYGLVIAWKLEQASRKITDCPEMVYSHETIGSKMTLF